MGPPGKGVLNKVVLVICVGTRKVVVRASQGLRFNMWCLTEPIGGAVEANHNVKRNIMPVHFIRIVVLEVRMKTHKKKNMNIPVHLKTVGRIFNTATEAHFLIQNYLISFLRKIAV